MLLSGQDPEPVREQDGQLLGRLSLVSHRLLFKFSIDSTSVLGATGDLV